MPNARRGQLSSEVIENVRTATDIVELVGQYVTLKRSGVNFKGLCPFHTEKTPSFHVRPDRQMYYCFGCQRGGDVFSFLIEHDGVGFAEAVRNLGGRAGIAVEVAAPGEGAHDELYAAAEAAAQYFTAQLHSPSGARARAYLQKRGIGRDLAERFRLGAAPEGWENLSRALAARGIRQEVLLALGLVARRSRGEGVYDTFRDRVIFAIRSLSGRVIGFGGRILPGTSAADAPKYLNSPDSPIYHKNRVLYGLEEARGAIRRGDSAILTEGYLDMLSLFQAGIEPVVAACGTAFGEAQAALLHRYTRRAYILGDSDPAGRRAAVRAAGLLLEHGFLVHVVELPSGYDPDAFVREHGAEAMAARLQEAPGYIAYMKLLVERRAGALAVKERVVRHLLDDLARVGDSLLQELYVKELCRSFALSEATVAGELETRRGRRSAAARPEPAPEPESPPATSAIREARRGLLCLALSSGSWAARLAAELEPDDFEPGVERQLFEALRSAGSEGHWRDHVSTPEDDSFGSELEFRGPPPGQPEQLFHDYRAALLEARIEQSGADLRRRLAEAEGRGDAEATARLLENQRALARERQELRRRPSVH